MDFGPLEVAHIIPFAYASWNNKAWEVLWRCFPDVREAGLRTIPNPRQDISRRTAVANLQKQQDLKLSSAALLDCHYRLAEILNGSGIARIVEGHLRDWEGGRMLSRVLRVVH